MNATIKKPGYALATILILLTVALFGIGAIISVSILESKISSSSSEGIKAYYVAEAGVQDALWRLGSDSSYNTAMKDGNLSQSYSSTPGIPGPNQSFTVTLLSTAPQYVTITVTGSSATLTSFTAKRQIIITAFMGTPSSPIDGYAVVAGSSWNINNGRGSFVVNGGNLYSSSSITINNATVNLGTNKFAAVGSYSANPNSHVTSGGINSSNYPPAAGHLSVPAIDFIYYSTHNTVSYTPAQFQDLITSGGNSITIAGPVTYISGSVNMNNWVANKTLNITGMLIISGSLNINGAAHDLNVNLIDPGNGQAGIFVKSSLNDQSGVFKIDGVLYAASSMNFNNSESVKINGGLISGSSINLNTGAQFDLTYNASRLAASFGSGTPGPIQVQHWEENY